MWCHLRFGGQGCMSHEPSLSNVCWQQRQLVWCDLEFGSKHVSPATLVQHAHEQQRQVDVVPTAIWTGGGSKLVMTSEQTSHFRGQQWKAYVVPLG
jgi:hypothetical protein